jgi:DNA-binding PadR family transcriptional regulator
MLPDDDFMEMLVNWESVYKRGLLTFWILLLLHDHPSFPYEINNEIEELSQGTMSADGNSIYRALRRFEEMGLVTSEIRISKTGPDRRYYELARRGRILLDHFIRRNLLVFQDSSIMERLQVVLEGTSKE